MFVRLTSFANLMSIRAIPRNVKDSRPLFRALRLGLVHRLLLPKKTPEISVKTTLNNPLLDSPCFEKPSVKEAEVDPGSNGNDKAPYQRDREDR